jgi:hypothetical protein
LVSSSVSPTGSFGLLVAKSSMSTGSESSGESSSSVNERPVALSGMGPRGLSASFFFPLALPPRWGFASGPKFRLRAGAGPAESNGRGPPNGEGGRGGPPKPPGRADRERPPVEHLTVELLDRGLGLPAIEKFHERKATRTTRIAVDGQHDLRRGRDSPEVRPKVRFSGRVRQIADKQADSQSTHSWVKKWRGKIAAGKESTHTRWQPNPVAKPYLKSCILASASYSKGSKRLL